MGKFTQGQKRIAVSLFNRPKSVDELSAELKMPFPELNDALKQMLKVSVVKVEGYPQKYVLAESVAAGVKRRKEVEEKDPFDMRIKAIIEVKAIEESFLEKHMSEIEQKLKDSKDYTVYDIFRAKPMHSEGYYSSYLEANLSAKDFTALVKFMYFFGPSSVEVLKPAKVTLAMDDLQDALMEMAEMIQSYNHAMLKSMNKEELADFSRKLYSSK